MASHNNYCFFVLRNSRFVVKFLVRENWAFFTNHSTCQKNTNQRKPLSYGWYTETTTCSSTRINHFSNFFSGQDLNFQPSLWRDQRRRRKKTQLLENDFNYYFPSVLYKFMMWLWKKYFSCLENRRLFYQNLQFHWDHKTQPMCCISHFPANG